MLYGGRLCLKNHFCGITTFYSLFVKSSLHSWNNGMPLWGGNLNSLISGHHFWNCLEQDAHIWKLYNFPVQLHLSEGGNYNEVLLTNTFKKFRQYMTVLNRNLMLAWWLLGIGTRLTWKQFYMFLLLTVFTLGTTSQLCYPRENKRNSLVCILGLLLRKNIPPWHAMLSILLESTHGHWMDDFQSISPSFLALLCLCSEHHGREISLVFCVFNCPYIAFGVLIHSLISRSMFLLVQ